MDWLAKLGEFKPCPEAWEWARQFPTAQEAWDACERGDWLLWYAARVGLTPERHRQIVTAACQIARRALGFIPAEESRPLRAIEAAEAWAAAPTPENLATAWAAADAAWAACAARAARAAAGAAEHKAHAAIVRDHLACP